MPSVDRCFAPREEPHEYHSAIAGADRLETDGSGTLYRESRLPRVDQGVPANAFRLCCGRPVRNRRPQLLAFTCGRPVVPRHRRRRLGQARGAEPQRIGQGDTVATEPNEEHWHGAGRRGPMAHIAVGIGETRWLEESPPPPDYPTSFSCLMDVAEVPGKGRPV